MADERKIPLTCRFFSPDKKTADRFYASGALDFPYAELAEVATCTNPVMGATANVPCPCQSVDDNTDCGAYIPETSQIVEAWHLARKTHVYGEQGEHVFLLLKKERQGPGVEVWRIESVEAHYEDMAETMRSARGKEFDSAGCKGAQEERAREYFDSLRAEGEEWERAPRIETAASNHLSYLAHVMSLAETA